jgi:predicted flap endonuclease-1-like 5' DNA nuclease
MSYKTEEIEGIGPVYAEKLRTAGIGTTADLLRLCGDAKGRKATAATTGLSESQLLKWANMADLMRISGVGQEYSELLEAAGVDTVKELRNRNAENLAAKMAEVNAVRKLTRTVPSEKAVAGWVEQAKSLDPLITH